MAYEPKTITEQSVLATPTANTFVIADHTYANGSVDTVKVSVPNIFKSLPGPYADDTAAATANVAVGSGYYTSAGAVRIRVS